MNSTTTADLDASERKSVLKHPQTLILYDGKGSSQMTWMLSTTPRDSAHDKDDIGADTKSSNATKYAGWNRGCR